eukprot:CAMPEP_0206507854 /NCGR_PEP_ID=MMETSP0324_2-20121206/57850_1 /ASSEMBLY_ACC=CAM_ASM_000836 /TAXON_ID=2866 /ORGANISM="Crypthecodinium cohnii, Strain Seligo" /LENGTH=284 /DNA_ID=CAMNT_0053998337 /DNA_START=39 /DNA_END=898 /DNA_ORIENTATION=-
MQFPMSKSRSAPPVFIFFFLLLEASLTLAAVISNRQQQHAQHQQLRATPQSEVSHKVLSGEDSSEVFKAALADFVRFEGNDSQAPPRVVVQVPETELKNFTKMMSKRCETQLLDGRSALHTFGEGAEQNESSCSDLNGTLCTVAADINSVEEQQGRKMSSSTKVHGASCLPVDCMEPADLKALVDFMQEKAQGAFGSLANQRRDERRLLLGGGGLVDIEGNPEILSKQAEVERSSSAQAGSAVALLAPVEQQQHFSSSVPEALCVREQRATALAGRLQEHWSVA